MCGFLPKDHKTMISENSLHDWFFIEHFVGNTELEQDGKEY